jgi:iron complex outermembrane receptor protein
LALAGYAALAASEATPEQVERLSNLSIEELANLDISSVSKTRQPLSDAPAAVYVITHDDIVRSGYVAMADILRLAPNLHVAQITAATHAISARGFNGSAADKLLVLIDGRSVYATFFSGVFWDSQDVPVEDIDRIEVISGPGATLWGANAVNGVINIITRSSAQTQGGLVEGGGGNLQRHGTAQVGGRINDALTWRAYAMGFDYSSNVQASGAGARDAWRKAQAGFRADWAGAADLFTLQGDIYKGTQDQLKFADKRIFGDNVVGRWTHQFAPASSLQVQAYYDYFERVQPAQASDYVHTYDLDLQHSFALGARQQVVWGGGLQVSRDRFPIVPGNKSSPFTQVFTPERRTLVLGNAFGQDTIALTRALKLTLGLKLEDDPFSGLAALPSARLSWKLNDSSLVWAAVSRAIRAPSRLDEDFSESLGHVTVLKGGDFTSEKLVAYELGLRTQPASRVSASLSGFYNVYTDLRSFELTNGRFPIEFANRMEGETYGLEAWGAFQAQPWWRLTAGASWLHKDLRFEPGASGLGGTGIAGDDPDYQLQLRSAMDLPHGITLDLDLRRIGALPSPPSPAYTELGARIAWPVTRRIELSLTGSNLLHAHHLEFGSTSAPLQLGASGVESGRSVSVDARWRF